MIWLAVSLQLAAEPPAVAKPADGDQHLTCADFRRNAEGAWSPLRVVKIGGATVTPTMQFSRGVSFGGVDAAAVLDAHCRPPRGR